MPPSITSSVAMDSMSSPDPLNETIPSSVARVTRSMARGTQSSLRSQRQGSTMSSPRKQTFELDVGNELSPQKILVTVEAEGGDKDHVTRRLFPSSASRAPRSTTRRRELTTETTTTTIPLRGLTDDEQEPLPDATTPRRRGRPRKSGTPMPSSKKRAGTPIDRSPNRNRRLRSETADSASETGVEDPDATPRPAVKFRKTPARKGRSPSKKEAKPAQDPGTAKKRGRPRRQALVPAEMEALADQDTMVETMPSAIPVKPVTEDLRLEETRISSVSMAARSPGSNAADDDDIWLAAVPDSRPSADPWKASGSINKESRSGHAEAPRAADLPASEASSQDGDVLADYGPSGADRSDLESDATESAARSDVDVDTIAQGEDFSMIMMDSIVSFRESMQYAEAALPEMGEATSVIVDRALEAIRQGRADDVQDRHPGRLHDSHSDQRYGDNGSSASPILEAAAPVAQATALEPDHRADAPRDNPSLAPVEFKWENKTHAPSPRRGKPAAPLGRQLALKSLNRDGSLLDTPLTSRSQPATSLPEETGLYDDSFSEIPEAVLEAATPRPLRRHQHLLSEQEYDTELAVEHHVIDNSHDHNEDLIDEEEAAAEDSQKAQSAAPESMVIDPAPPSDTASRLLTPDETPPPVDEEHPVFAAEDTMAASDDSQDDELRSSPPAFRPSTREASRSSSSAIIGRMAKDSAESLDAAAERSPGSPRLQGSAQDGNADNLDLPSMTARPALSPIVRVGRALQNVTSDPPSPRGPGSSLGSPFGSSVSRGVEDAELAMPGAVTGPPPPPPAGGAAPEPSSVVGSERPWARVLNPLSQIKSLVSQGAQMFSPRAVIPQAAVDDPFAPDSDMPSPKASFRVNKPSPRPEEPGLGPRVHSKRVPSRDMEEGMDWEGPMSAVAPESQQARGGPASGAVESRAASFGLDRRTVAEHRHGGPDEPIGAAFEAAAEEEPPSGDAMEVVEDGEEEEDDDIWAVEASRPTPSPVKRQPVQDPTLNLWSRGKLPSPWTKTATPRVASDSEEFSLLSVQERDLSQASMPKPWAQPAHAQVARTSADRVDLSNFFSSPAVVPRLQPFAADDNDNDSPAQPVDHGRERMPGSVAAALNPTVVHAPTAERPTRSGQNPPSVPQKAFQPNGQQRLDLFSPAPPREPRENAGQLPPPGLSQPGQPKPLFTQLAQKRNFTPHVGTSGGRLFAPAPHGGARNTAPSGNATTRGQNRHLSSDADVDGDESSFVAPVLKPLPNRAASPTKSCLRSPLKPKTPGRVVEFTNSTLSPLGQEQARAQQDPPQMGSGGDAMELDDDATQGDIHRPAREVEKEKQTRPSLQASRGNVAPMSNPALLQSVVLAPPTGAVAKAATAAPRLSQTHWSRAHWIRMDLLLQERRKGSLNFQLQHRVGVSQKRRSAALLGKHVSAQGETMALEQWHLDVVDAFRTELGAGCNWDEHVLSKRLFALLVGEERRRATKGGRPRALGTMQTSRAN